MDSIDLEVLKTCAQWIEAGQRCELVTVIRTWGSSPRPEGATLAICEDGQVVGSVSGGCIEDDLIARVREEGIKRVVPEIVTYGITADEAHRFGLKHHRGRRLRETIFSELTQVKGISDKTAEKLLNEFKSIAKIKENQTILVDCRSIRKKFSNVSDENIIYNYSRSCSLGYAGRVFIVLKHNTQIANHFIQPHTLTCRPMVDLNIV